MNSRTVAVIPARGGSKGIRHKNLRPVAGRPILQRNIEAARLSQHIDAVYVSTDDPDYARHAREWGAEVVMRPADLASDTASSESALLHALDEIERREGQAPEVLVFLQCTSPLTTAADIDACLELRAQQNADVSFSATPSHSFLWKSDENGNAVGVNHDRSFRPRRQDRQPEYRETGAIYAMSVAGFRKYRHRFFGHVAIYPVPGERAWEIDDPADFAVCEALAHFAKEDASSLPFPKDLKAVLFDFDGVFTDNRVWVNQDGIESVACNRSDGLRLSNLKETGLALMIVSKEQNPVVTTRAQKLKLPVMQGIDDKPAAINAWLQERGWGWEQVIYVGNDLNDADCLKRAGCGVAVADAYPEAKQAADFILSRAGGHGAIRELCDLLLQHLNA
ncbi:MAG: acylneuraminate cytidylyltransferase [Verrucomicrobiota bacterium JB022]|nr:acylneuraminate cytidylyltransferase [Verrucomicrobiota bacterium JB022]